MNSLPREIPDVKECLDLMEQYHMLPNIKDHSIVVAGVAEIISSSLITLGHELSMDKVIAGALLHDIGKTACLDNDDDHAAKGVEICLAHNLEHPHHAHPYQSSVQRGACRNPYRRRS